MDGLYFRCLQILNWAGNILTGIHVSSGQGTYSSAILIFLLPWIQNLQEEAEMHSIFVGCGVEPEAVVFWTCYYGTVLAATSSPFVICYYPGLRLKGVGSETESNRWLWPKVAGWGCTLLLVGYERRKRKDSIPQERGESVSRSVVGAGTSSKDRKAHLCLWKIHWAPENKEEMIS